MVESSTIERVKNARFKRKKHGFIHKELLKE
jgi:hypothetical protein